MSKSLRNAIFSLRANDKTAEEIRQLVEESLAITFVTWSNVKDHLDELVESLPGWTILDAEEREKQNGAVLRSSEGQTLRFGCAISGGMCVSQWNSTFVPNQWTPPGFCVRPPISIVDLAERIKKLELTPPDLGKHTKRN